WFILREAGVVFAIGVPIGLALTFAASHFIGALLYEISPLDPRIHFVTVLILLGAGFLASFIPARRAVTVDHMVALRYEYPLSQPWVTGSSARPWDRHSSPAARG